MKDLVISDDALAWAKIHRTQLTKTPDPRAAYQTELFHDYANMASWLPEDPKVILDIGAGMAGIDILLHRHYEERGKHVEFILMDKTGDSPLQAGFNPAFDPFMSMDVTKKFLEENGIAPDFVHAEDPNPEAALPEVGLVVSLLSWCHHYPASVYYDLVKNHVPKGGRMILDIRNGTTGVKTLTGSGQFQVIGTCAMQNINVKKSTRTVFQKIK